MAIRGVIDNQNEKTSDAFNNEQWTAMQEEDDLPILFEDHNNVAHGTIDSREICTCMYHGRPSASLASTLGSRDR
jgi:hypothetical protein